MCFHVCIYTYLSLQFLYQVAEAMELVALDERDLKYSHIPEEN